MIMPKWLLSLLLIMTSTKNNNSSYDIGNMHVIIIER